MSMLLFVFAPEGLFMASEPYGDMWGGYQRRLKRRKVVPGEGFSGWLRRNPQATHPEFEKAFPKSLTPAGFKDVKKRFLKPPNVKAKRKRLAKTDFIPAVMRRK